MRKEYHFSRGVRGRSSRHGRIPPAQSTSAGKTLRSHSLDDEPLTKAQVRELRRRVADLDNPIRYLLVSQIAPRFKLYYNVADDHYVMNEPQGGTLFKRRKAALAVRQLLGPGVKVIRCTTKRDKGMRVPILPKGSRRVKARAK